MMLILQYKFVKKAFYCTLLTYLHQIVTCSSYCERKTSDWNAGRKKELVTTTAKTFRLDKQIQIRQI